MSQPRFVTQRLSRRAFVSLAVLSGALGITFKPRGTYAQQSDPPRHVGVLLVNVSPESKEARAFREGLRDAGYSEGHDVVIEWRAANGDYEQVPRLVADLIQRKVDVIVAETTVATRAAKHATATIPIVMALVSDPVGAGLVASLAHPGGNVTGLSVMTAELSAKRLQLLAETIPQLSRAVVLWNPDSPFHTKVIEELRAAAFSLSIELSFVSARTPEEIDSAFSAVNRAHPQALYIIEDPLFFTHRRTLLKLASKIRVPIIYAYKAFAEEGALLSYGTSLSDLMRRSAATSTRS